MYDRYAVVHGSGNVPFDTLWPDYTPKAFQISRITFYTARGLTSLAAGQSAEDTPLTDFTFQPFGSWSEGGSGFRGGRELRECGIASAGGTRAKVSYIPSKKDRQFIFQTLANATYTDNELCLVVDETTNNEIRQDCYIDFEVTRWGYTLNTSEWTTKTCRTKPLKLYRCPGASLEYCPEEQLEIDKNNRKIEDLQAFELLIAVTCTFRLRL